jgi:hypothetical protein
VVKKANECGVKLLKIFLESGDWELVLFFIESRDLDGGPMNIEWE